MWKATFTLVPCFYVINLIGKSMMNSADRPLCPHALYLLVHTILNNSLYKAMDCQRSRLRIAPNERKT